MRFLLDESADARLAPYLARAGHDVTVIARDYPNALDDQTVLAIAYDEGRILVTNDTDFGKLIVREGRAHAGIILFRVRPATFANQRARLAQVLSEHRDQLHQFLVVEQGRVRVRHPS